LIAVGTSAAPIAAARLVRREPLAWVTGSRYAPPAAPVPLVLLGPECPVRQLALAGSGRLSFYAFARPAHQATERTLRQ
jgi:hypothetical protein